MPKSILAESAGPENMNLAESAEPEKQPLIVINGEGLFLRLC